MTCIVAIAQDNKVYMGIDSIGITGNSYRIRTDKTLIIKNKVIFGNAGSFKLGEIIEFRFKPPKQRKSLSNKKYIYTDFIDSLKKCIHKHDDKCIDKSEILLGYKGEIYKIYGDLQIEQINYNFNTCGCGGDLSLGSLYSTHEMNLKPNERLKLALEASVAFNSSVKPPFQYLEL